MSRRMLGFTLFVSGILRLVQIDSAPFWYDEGVSTLFSRLPLSDMITATAGDVHPPGYYLITWVIDKVGLPTNELTMRLPSVFLSLISIYLVWELAKRFELTKGARIAAVAWVAFSPVQLHYAQEARMYALLQLEVLGLFLLLLDRRWFWFGVVATMMLYTHNYAVFYLPTLGLVAILRYGGRWKRMLYWLPAFIVPLMLWLPWLFTLLGQMQTVAGGYWIQAPTVGSVLFILYQLLFAYSMPQFVQGLAVMVTGGLITFSLWKILSTQPEGHRTLLIMSFAPLVMAIVASFVWKPLLLFRGLIGSSVPLILLILMGMSQVKVQYKQVYAAIMVAFVVIAGTVGHFKYNAINKGRAKEWVNDIAGEYQPGDAVLALNDNGVVAISVYQPTFELYKVPSCGEESLGSLSPATRKGMGIVEKHVEDLDNERIWFISTIAPVSSWCELETSKQIIEQYDAELYQSLEKSEYVNAGVYLIDG
mgnify:CR=1 FL=1